MSSGREIEKANKKIAQLTEIINELVEENYNLKTFYTQADVKPVQGFKRTNC